MRGAASLAILFTLAGCSTDEEPFMIRIVAGVGETPFAGTPTVARVELRVRTDGAERAVGTVPVSATSFEVPEAAKSGVGSLVLAGLGADGAALAYGRTPQIELAGLSGVATVSLAIFVQRTSSLTAAIKLPGTLATPRCASIGTRYAIFGDGAAKHADVLDMLDWTIAREDAFETPPVTIATAGSLLLTIDKDGKASLIDLGGGARTTPVAPEGVTFGDVLGGQVIRDETGAAWIVGPTRLDAASDVVMRLGTDGAIIARKLLRARKAAGATWVTGRGLVVAYGEDTLGVELLAANATASAPLPFPADPRAAGVLAAIDGSRVLRVDPDGAVTTLDLACAKDCVPAATTLKDEARAPRADDHASPLEGGGAVLVRGGRVLRLSRDASALDLLHDGGASAVCSTPLPNGSVGLAIAADDVLRTISPAR